MKRIRKGDKVVVLAGKYKGKTGDVLRVCSNDKIYVDGINMIKKCQKPNPQRNEKGGIIEKEAPIHISNVSIYDEESSKGSRIGFKYLEDNTKVRVYKTSKKAITN